ncbi:hypothetical protein C3L33_09123, partial [Rhododendron williamsianum]
MRRAGDVCFSQVFRDRDGGGGRGFTGLGWVGLVSLVDEPMGLSCDKEELGSGGMRGIVDYTSYDDMRYAIRKLDDSLFRNQFDRAYIRQCTDSHLVLKAAAQYALAIRLLWNVIQDVATQGVPVIQEAEVPAAAIAIVAGVEDPAFGGDLELRVRGLVGYGAQITATHLVVEISIDIQISATIASSSYLCKHEAVYDLPSRIMFMELVSFSLLVRNGYDLVEAELVRLSSLS